MSSVIAVEHLSKRFRLPLDRSRTLKYRMVHWRSSSRYRTLDALHDVSFDVPTGQFLGIIGRNGSGKSTLLKVLSRIYRPSSGRMTIRGRVSPFLELGVGFNPELTARENVILNGSILGLTRRELERRMDAIIHFADLEEFVDTKLKNFSSGMQVRLAFTVAIQADAETLLMDEVLAVGDAAFQAKCFDIFNRYKREGRTVVLVTHDLAAVDAHCDRALMIENGRLTADAASTDVTARYRRLIGERQDLDRERNLTSVSGVRGARPDASRWGTGDIRVDEVALLRGDGSSHVSFLSDEPVSVRIDATAQQDVDDLVVGIAVYRADGLLIAGTNTNIAQLQLPVLHPGDHLTVEYRLPRLTLLSGGYLLSVAMHPRVHTRTYDHLEQAFEMRVADQSGRVGLADLGGAWHVVDVQTGAPSISPELRALQNVVSGDGRA